MDKIIGTLISNWKKSIENSEKQANYIKGCVEGLELYSDILARNERGQQLMKQLGLSYDDQETIEEKAPSTDSE